VAASVIVAIALVAAAVVAAGGGPSSSTVSHPATTHRASTAYKSVPAAHTVRTAVAAGRTAAPASGTAVTVDSTSVGRPLPAGFVGLSLEIRTLENFVGSNPAAIDPVFVQLVRNLAPGQRPVVRFGGESTDFTWSPIAHESRPIGVRYAITKTWLQLTRAVSQELNARLILGVDLEVNSAKVAAAEGHAMVSGIGQQWIEGLELGNEPELYGGNPWFTTHRVPYYGRPHSYDFGDYLHDFSNISRSLPRVALAGPSVGSARWSAYLGRFLGVEPRVRVATLHRYPLKRCTSSKHVTINELLANASSIGLALSVAPYARIAHRHGVPLRIDEMNSVSCGGESGVSNTFASALWAVDALFTMARVGVDGVNIHTKPKNVNELFSFQRVKGRWQASVHPEYYGLMMFAQAAPAGARLLRISGAGGSLAAWATKATDGQLRVVLINKDTGRPRTVRLQIPSKASVGTLERLQAPNVQSTTDATLGGQTLGSGTGLLGGTARDSAVIPASGRYVVTLPPASAAMLTLSSR
jgi:Glycosyl hydrolase family 79 C-terminal beta domain